MTNKTIANQVNKKIQELTRKNFRDDNWHSVYDVVISGIQSVIDQANIKSFENDYELEAWVENGGYVYDRDNYFVGKEWQLKIIDKQQSKLVATGYLRACPVNNTVDRPFEFTHYEIYGCVFASSKNSRIDYVE